MITIQEIHGEFSRRLSSLGRVVIAGGAVRDTLMGRTPKDWDVFVLQGGEFNFGTGKALAEASLADLPVADPVVEWHQSEPFLASSVRYEQQEVQIMLSPEASVAALVGTFDWNVSLFAFDGNDYFKGEQIDNIVPGKSLRLQADRFPLSSLRRGFRFSERFKMKLENADVLRLCEKIVADGKAKPQGSR